MISFGKVNELYDYGEDEELRHKQNIEYMRGLINFIIGCFGIFISLCAALVTLILVALGKIKI